MAIISSPILHLKPKICKKTCKACGLSICQGPIHDYLKISNVFWVGLSAVKFEEGEERLPLSPLTASGALISTIEQPFLNKISFYKTNLVKCAPLVGNKLRYPLEHEMDKCFPNFQWELEKLKPATVFLLGKQVASFVFRKLSDYKPSFNENFTYSSFKIKNINFIPIHHPSYILVYKRKNLNQYIENVRVHLPIECVRNDRLSSLIV